MSKHTDIAYAFKQRFINLLTGKWAYRLNEISGCSEEEIKFIESKYSISLPESYRVFLSEFGHMSKSFFLSFEIAYDYPLELTEFFYSQISNSEDEYIPPTDVPENMFVFASYLYEDFYFFFTDTSSDDPPVYLSNTAQGGGEPFTYKKLDDSVWDFLEECIKYYEDGKKEGRWFVDS
jgi:SMI1 / KNR4 family (SUKH-1)